MGSVFNWWFLVFSQLEDGEENKTKPIENQVLLSNHVIFFQILHSVARNNTIESAMPQISNGSSAYFLSEEAKYPDDATFSFNVPMSSKTSKSSLKKKSSSSSSSISSSTKAVLPVKESSGLLSFRSPFTPAMKKTKISQNNILAPSVTQEDTEKSDDDASDGSIFFDPQNTSESFEAANLEDLDTFPEALSDPLEREIPVPSLLQSDEARNQSFVRFVQTCTNGEDLFNALFKLLNTGNTTGFSITMNRVVRSLTTQKMLPNSDVKSSTWAKCKKDGRDHLIKKVFTDIKFESSAWGPLTDAILEGFGVKKPIMKKRESTLIGDDELRLRESTGTVCDRTALLACALADPELLDLWQDISRPIDSDARPGEPIPSSTPGPPPPL